MSEMQRNRSMGGETMKITVIGALAIAAVIIAAVLLIRHLNRTNDHGPDQHPV
jgi:hypothetical protein